MGDSSRHAGLTVPFEPGLDAHALGLTPTDTAVELADMLGDFLDHYARVLAIHDIPLPYFRADE